MTKQADKGYLLPEVIDPGSFKCIRAYVPDDPLYIAAFWGSYEFLANWLAWERDAAKRGKNAAVVWREAFERARAEWECSGGTCGIMDIRQKPDEPCIIQKQTDCDGLWDDAVIMPLCVPKMRLVAQGDGFVIQQWNGTEWVTTDEETPPFEDRYDGPYTPQWTNPPVGQAGNCLAAVNAAYVINQYMTQVAQLHVDAAAFLTIFSAFVAAVSFWVDFPLTDLATTLITAFAEFAGDWQDVVDYDMVPGLVPILLCQYEADGSMTRASFDQVLADMATYRLGLVDDYKRVKWALAILYVNALGNVGMSRFAAAAGIDEGDCSGVDCGWFVEFDFTQDDYGWEAEDVYGYDAGEWVEGVGWQGVYAGTQSVNGAYRVWIHSPVVDGATYYKGLFEIDFDEGERDYSFYREGILVGGVYQGYFVDSGGVYAPPPLVEGVIQGEDDLTGTQGGFQCGTVHNGLPQPEQGQIGGVILKRIRLFGTGDNPWQ